MQQIILLHPSVCFYSGSQDDVCICIDHERGDLLMFIPGLILIMLMMCILVAI